MSFVLMYFMQSFIAMRSSLILGNSFLSSEAFFKVAEVGGKNWPLKGKALFNSN